MTDNKKTIWIINQYASHLTTRHEELARSFASQGYGVAVITSSFHHGRREYMFDTPVAYTEPFPGVTYVYLHSGPSYQSNGAGRILNMLDFCRLVGKYQKEIAEKTGRPSFVIASSAPPFVWETGYKTAKKFKAKFIAEFRDIWPMSLVDIQGVSPNHPLVKMLDVVEKRAYKRADAIVSTMPYAYKHVMEVADVPREKIHWMPNGINVADVKASLESDMEIPKDLKEYLDSHWCGVYIGSIVKSECLDHILKSIKRVKNEGIYFAIIGEGHEKESVMKLASDLGLERVKFFPAIDKHLIPKVLERAKLCFAAHNDLPIYHYGLSMNKLNDYLASGIPAIFACNAKSIVGDAGHFAIPMDDEQIFADTIEKVKGLSDEERAELKEKAVSLIARDYDYPEIGKKYLAMMEAL